MREHAKSPRPKLLIVIDTLGVGGAERSSVEIAKRLSEFEMTICAMSGEPEVCQLGHLKDVRVEAIAGPSGFSIRTFSLLVGLMRRLQPNLVHLVGTFATLLGTPACMWLRKPYVQSFTNEAYTSEHLSSVPQKSRWKLALVKPLIQWSLRRASRVVAISETVKQVNCGAFGFPVDSVDVIYRGRDVRDFAPPEPADLERLRSELALGNDNRVILNVARLLRRKGQRELIAAVSRMNERGMKCVLLVAGEGPYRTELESYIAGKGLDQVVHLLGTRQDVPSLLQLCDVFVFPSWFEGHGGALVEAMMAGRPIVAADTPVHRESIIHGETGLLVPVGNENALAEAIGLLLENRAIAQLLGRRAHEFALQRFNIDRIAEAYSRLYQEILQD